MTERVLTRGELNRALLARQLLLERRRLPVARAIERLGALQAQWPPAPYVALWSRVEGFERATLTRALERRSVVKATLMRMTLHLTSAADYSPYAEALRDAWLAQLTRRANSDGVADEVRRFADRAVALAAEAPRRKRELLDTLVAEVPAALDLVWSLLQTEAGLVHTPASAAWRRTTQGVTYVPARAWLPRERGRREPPLEHLLRRYLAAFGPASVADAASWTGLPAPTLRSAFEKLEPGLARFLDEAGRTLFDLRRAPRPDAGLTPPVRFLPQWDSAILAYTAPDRGRILPERLRKRVIRNNGDVLPTFLVDGFVAGTWTVERAREAAELVLEPLEPLPRGSRAELGEEGAALVRFVEPDAARHRVAVRPPA